MRDLSCLKTIISDNLAVHIDLSSVKSWDLNTGFTSVSLSKWSGAYANDIFLYDFGLTGFDNGRVDEMTDSLNLYRTDTKVKLFRVGYNTPTGGTFYDGFGITGMTATTTTGTSVGNYFMVDGGYLQGFFKLKDYNFQVMPYRYAKGVTFETLLYLTPESFNDGYFLLLGARAEDKYIPEFSGETIQYDKTITTIVNGSRGDYEVSVVEKEWSGVTTSEDNHLNSISNKLVTKKAINNNIYQENIEIENIDNDIDNNVIGFRLSSDRKLGYTRFDAKGFLVAGESNNIVPTGWTMIAFKFEPYEDITDPSLLDCTAPRKGDFSAFVNGRLAWKIENFDEFYFRGFKNSKEKQLGVPYTLSWGGGSFGLKHSYHWDLNPRTIFDGNSPLDIGTGFTFVNDPTIAYECPPEPVSGYTQYITISGDNTTFSTMDPCEPFTISATTVLAITQISGSTGSTSATTTNEYFIQYSEDLDLISNRDYTFKVNFFNRDIFRELSTGETGMFFIGDVDIEVLEEVPYYWDTNHANEWFEIFYKIRLAKNTNKQKIKVGFYVKSDKPLADGFAFYFDNFTYTGSDKLVQDSRKQGQRIEQTYSTSFVGGMQKLRIYDAALTNQEILHNSLTEFKNKGYGVTVSKGGRLIYV